MVAEFESDLIRLRTGEGMKVAKAKGRLRGKQCRSRFDKWGSEAPGHVCSEKPVPSEVVIREAADGWSRSRVVDATSAWRHPDALPVGVAQGCPRASTRPLS